MAPATDQEEGGEASSGSGSSRPGASHQGRKRARATDCEDEKNAEPPPPPPPVAADSASPPAEHASSGASSAVSSPLRRPSLARAVIGVDAFGGQILEHFHKIDPAIVKAYGKLKKKYFAKQDGKLLRRTSGFLIDWDADRKIDIILTSVVLIETKSPSIDEWSATDEYSPHAKVCVHLMDKADTTVAAELLHYDKHYNLALFKVAMDLSTQIPSFASEVKFAEEVFMLGRDKRRNLCIDHGYVEYKGPSSLHRHHYIFISCGINMLGIGGPVINHSGQVVGMFSLPEMAFVPSSIILKCLHMWKRFNCIPRLHVGMKFSAISLLDLPHREKIACKCDVDDGLIVTGVPQGSIAEKLGVRNGDIIKFWSGENISTTIELENFLLDMCKKHLDKGNTIGSSVDISVGIFHMRKNSHGTIKMTLNVSDNVEVITKGTYPVTAAHCTMLDDDDNDNENIVQEESSSRETPDDEDEDIESYSPSGHHGTRVLCDEEFGDD